MKPFASLFLMMFAVGACTGRQVEVGTDPQPATAADAVMLRVTNSLAQGVNVYVVTGSTELFVRQIGANATEQVTVQGVSPGAVVTLRARQVDGLQVYERDNVILSGGVYEWRVP